MQSIRRSAKSRLYEIRLPWYLSSTLFKRASRKGLMNRVLRDSFQPPSAGLAK
jgi:hypothetical protein